MHRVWGISRQQQQQQQQQEQSRHQRLYRFWKVYFCFGMFWNGANHRRSLHLCVSRLKYLDWIPETRQPPCRSATPQEGWPWLELQFQKVTHSQPTIWTHMANPLEIHIWHKITKCRVICVVALAVGLWIKDEIGNWWQSRLPKLPPVSCSKWCIR